MGNTVFKLVYDKLDWSNWKNVCGGNEKDTKPVAGTKLQGLEPKPVSIKFSIKDCEHAATKIAQDIARILREYEVPPGCAALLNTCGHIKVELQKAIELNVGACRSLHCRTESNTFSEDMATFSAKMLKELEINGLLNGPRRKFSSTTDILLIGDSHEVASFEWPVVFFVSEQLGKWWDARKAEAGGEVTKNQEERLRENRYLCQTRCTTLLVNFELQTKLKEIKTKDTVLVPLQGSIHSISISPQQWPAHFRMPSNTATTQAEMQQLISNVLRARVSNKINCF